VVETPQTLTNKGADMRNNQINMKHVRKWAEGKNPAAKPLKGYHGAGVVEIVDNHSGNTYRIVYTTKLEGVIYVLDAFQKKAKTGIETPKQDIDLINNRLKTAIEYHKLRFKK